jgi:hypothetical protein
MLPNAGSRLCREIQWAGCNCVTQLTEVGVNTYLCFSVSDKPYVLYIDCIHTCGMLTLDSVKPCRDCPTGLTVFDFSFVCDDAL